MHDGHRKRMKKRFLEGGRLSDHELLEMLLCYAIPRKNTNDIAHRLLAHFESLDGVLTADERDLASVLGMGENSALLLKLIGRIRGATECDRNDGIYLDYAGAMGEYAVEVLSGNDRESVWAALMTSHMRVTDCVCVSGGGYFGVEVDTSRLLASPWLMKSSSVVLFHNHPNGELTASDEDLEFSARVAELLALSGITVVENVIVSGDRYALLVGDMVPREGEKSSKSGRSE